MRTFLIFCALGVVAVFARAALSRAEDQGQTSPSASSSSSPSSALSSPATSPSATSSSAASSSASASLPSGAQAPVKWIAVAPTEAERNAGLWREGKAVFSDWQLFDIFLKYARGYKPAQPIRYSHQIHVEKNGMECQYCHSGVAKAPFATVPSLELCMGCHKIVKTVNGEESPEIKKLTEYWEKGTPVQWEPVNNLPEVSHFNHERHIKSGVGCQVCHGQVQKMEVVEKASSLKMGFCVSCHRERGASIDCAVCHY